MINQPQSNGGSKPPPYRVEHCLYSTLLTSRPSGLLSLLLRKRWTVEFESLLFILLYTKKRYQGKILDTFSGAEGETRQGKPCLACFASSPILCPFCSAKDGLLSSSLSYSISHSPKRKSTKIIPCASSGAEGETRTLAPVSRPTPLAGAPRHQLEYFRR